MHHRALSRALRLEILPLWLMGCASLTLVGLAAGLVGLSTRAGVLPGPADALLMAAWLSLPGLAIALPASTLFATVAAARSWVEQGEAAALAQAGMGQRPVASRLMALCVPLALLQLGLGHVAGPTGTRQAAGVLAQSASTLDLLPGLPVQLGPVLLVRALDGQGLWVATEGRVAAARAGALEAGPVLHLEDLTVIDLDGAWTGTAEEGVVRLPSANRRIELVERTSGDLARLVARMEADGRAAGAERYELSKRSWLAVSVPLLGMLGWVLGARGVRPLTAAAGTAVAWWSVLRLCDKALDPLGPMGASAIPPLLLAIAVLVAWARWRER